MKTFLLGIALAAILIATVPAIRNAGHSPSIETRELPPPTSAPTDERLRNYRSPLGGNGGLGTASLSESEVGRIQVYTVTNLPAVTNGQVVRLRLSRPTYESKANDDRTYSVGFIDQDLKGGVAVKFPYEGAVKMDLIHSHSQPGLSFYVALEPDGLRAVGQVWRPDSKTYVW